MNSYSRLLYFVKPYYKRMIFAVFCMIVAAAAYLVVPWLIKNVVDQVLDEKNMFMLNLIVGAIILIFLIRGLLPMVKPIICPTLDNVSSSMSVRLFLITCKN